MEKRVIGLILILVLASILRLWGLVNAPAGFNADEAAIGYNAYSILKTGKDEYGNFWPLVFKSFGDYKPGLYVYLVMPLVAILGLSELAVRLPNAILGIATVWLIYLLAKKLFRSEAVGLVAAMLLAISPWHIHFSRGGWESNAATFFLSLGVYLFIKFKEDQRYFFGSMLAFLAAMYVYQSPRLIVPLLLVGFFLPLANKLKSSYYRLILPSLLLIVIALPLVWQFIGGEGVSRFNGLSFLADPGPTSRLEQLRGEHQEAYSWSTKLVHNKLTAYLPQLFRHYLDHFSPDFLFINGDEVARNKVPETGQLYLIESIMLLIGLYYLVKEGGSGWSIILVWLIVAPSAAALTFQTPSALRGLNMIVPLSVISALGLVKILATFNQRLVKIILAVVIVVSLSFELSHYLESYLVHYPKRYPDAWEYGFKEMVSKLMKYQDRFDKVVITDRYDQPYILVLFYEKYDPSQYQPQAHLTQRDKFNFGTVRSFDKYQFRPFTKNELEASTKTLFIGTPKDVTDPDNVFDQVNFPSGERAFFFARS